MYAGWPPTLTVTLSSVVGRLPLTMALAQVSVVAARKPPLMVSHALGATPGRKLAPFCTSVMMGLVSAPTGKVSDWLTNNAGTTAPFNATAQIFGPAFFLWPGGYAVATRTDY